MAKLLLVGEVVYIGGYGLVAATEFAAQGPHAWAYTVVLLGACLHVGASVVRDLRGNKEPAGGDPIEN